ncbi:MAG: hypothetical protein CVU84_01390 [Firmicutes bacterium HGW-Firmicutes-1]|jgi:hypothetical protein|nr:MAG: hypothetical protein CVU84_01390 [Firmicutes bacterium HGW-Firmicutes-1]
MSVYIIDKNAKEFSDDKIDILNKDPSINGNKANSLANEFKLSEEDFNKLFLKKYGIAYIDEYFSSKGLNYRIISHPYETDTCFEKADLLESWDPLNVIKALYFEYSVDHTLYAVVVPETGCFINTIRLKEILNLKGSGFLKKAQVLPEYMSYGTCSPFITDNDIGKAEGKVEKIIFDLETLKIKKKEKLIDDFSFGTDHRFSMQMNYYHCYKMLKILYPKVIVKKNILNLSFKEKFVRTKGRIKITYDFESINYKTAKFINSNHGYGDVSIMNDYVDELDIPKVLVRNETAVAMDSN